MVTQSASTWLVAGMGVTEGHELPASVTVTGSTALVRPVTVTGLGETQGRRDNTLEPARKQKEDDRSHPLFLFCCGSNQNPKPWGAAPP